MKKQILNNLEFLQTFKKSKNKKSLLKNSSPAQTKLAVKIFSKLLDKKLDNKLTKSQLKKVKLGKPHLKLVKKNQRSIKKIKKIFGDEQRGGALASLLALAVPALIGALT